MTPRPRILIVEDEPDIVFSLQEDLGRQGYDTGVSREGDDAILRGSKEPWDLILLDVMLPGADGFEVCATLRGLGVSTPIILLTARSREAEKERGLDAGADDYVIKPFSLRELRARIRAQLRRGGGDSRGADPLLRFGNWELDVNRAELRHNGAVVEITAQEFRLIQVFLRNRGRVLSREQLIEAAWGRGMSITDRAVDTHVFNLRKKIEEDPSSPRFIRSARGLGYRFEA